MFSEEITEDHEAIKKDHTKFLSNYFTVPSHELLRSKIQYRSSVGMGNEKHHLNLVFQLNGN
jgi:hypothetical protein